MSVGLEAGSRHPKEDARVSLNISLSLSLSLPVSFSPRHCGKSRYKRWRNTLFCIILVKKEFLAGQESSSGLEKKTDQRLRVDRAVRASSAGAKAVQPAWPKKLQLRGGLMKN